MEPIVRVSTLFEHRFAHRDIVSSVRTRYRAANHRFSIMRDTHHPWLPYLHSRLDNTQSSPARPFHGYQFLRITSSTRDLMRSILPPVKPNILHTRTLSRNWRIYKPLVVGNVMNFNEARGYKTTRRDALRRIKFWQDFSAYLNQVYTRNKLVDLKSRKEVLHVFIFMIYFKRMHHF